MPDLTLLTGEDRVVVVAIIVVALVALVALAALVLAPSMTGNIIPLASVAISTISVLAARHPPVLAATATIPILPPPAG